jgi:hypothetical protein
LPFKCNLQRYTAAGHNHHGAWTSALAHELYTRGTRGPGKGPPGAYAHDMVSMLWACAAADTKVEVDGSILVNAVRSTARNKECARGQAAAVVWCVARWGSAR